MSSLAGSGSSGPFNSGDDCDLAIARSRASANDFPSIVATAVALSFGVSPPTGKVRAIESLPYATNAARGVKVIGPRGEGSKKITPPSKAQLRTLIEAAPDHFRLMLIFAASTGARAGEQWAAQWRDLDLDKCELQISRRVDAYGEVGAPKTTAGVRTVPLSTQLVTMLKAHKIKSKFSKLEDFIFTNNHGHHVGHDNLVKRRFLPLFEATKIARFNWHGLRHFAVSTWIEAGLAPKTVQTFACHASLQVTMDRYGHLFPSDDHRRAMDHIASANNW